MNIMEINGYHAVISYDPEINMFRGEFVGINGGADFYASSVDQLRKEGETSLKAFLEMCAEDGVEPRKHKEQELSKEQMEEIAKLSGMADEDIDYSDIPPVEDWSDAVVGKLKHPHNTMSCNEVEYLKPDAE